MPSLLTILGVVMFLLFGEVTGRAGLDRAIMIVLLANVVSILTSLSLAVIATNAKVGGGGDYFLISRSLGLEFGGAIGTVLYLAQSISVGFYVVGFTDAFIEVIGLTEALNAAAQGQYVPAVIGTWHLPTWALTLPLRPMVSTVMAMLLFGVAYKGADVGTKVQYFILFALVFALGSYFWGAWISFDPDKVMQARDPATATMLENAGITGPNGFWIIFAVFFPAITGFTQGVSMSGDLRDPQKSLPLGTFFAVGVSMVVYLALPIFMTATATQEQLLTDNGAETWKRVAVFPWMVDVGVFAATISSALASLMGAPRILTAMASDRIFPGSHFFSKAHAGTSDPRRAMVLTLVIGLGAIWTGELSAIAQVVTMFFLLSYGALNWATYIEGASMNPAFRPRFRISGWRTSLVGAIVCAAVMLAIDPAATIAAAAVLVALYEFLKRRDLDHPGGDARRGYFVQRIKSTLLKLGQHPTHARNWRPVVLAVREAGEEDGPVSRFAQAISSSQGVLTLVTVLVGDFADVVEERQRRREEIRIAALTTEEAFFREIAVGETQSDALRGLQLCYGMGQLRPNTLVLPWTEEVGDDHERILTDAAALDYNVILFYAAVRSSFYSDGFDDVPAKKRRIDVWWRGHQNGSLAVLLAHLVRENATWRGSTLRLLRIEQDPQLEDAARAELEDLVENSRIAAEVLVVVDDRPPFTVIGETSRDSHLVFMGVGGVGGAVRADLARYHDVLQALPTTALVFASQNLDVEV